jgi:hypothetical protein
MSKRKLEDQKDVKEFNKKAKKVLELYKNIDDVECGLDEAARGSKIQPVS